MDFGDSFVWKYDTRMYTDVFSFKKDSKTKKREYVSLVGVVFHWGSSILPVLHCRLTLKLSCQAT